MQQNLVERPDVAAGAKCTTLEALAALATRLGITTSVEELRRRSSIEEGEPSTDTLIAIAREIGLQAKSIRMTFAELPKLSKALPAILRGKGGGALILEDARSDPMRGSVAVICDPTGSEEDRVAIEEIRLAEFWEGEVILVKRSLSSAEEEQAFGIGWIVGQVFRERKLFRDLMWGALASTLFVVAPPFMFMIVTDKVL